VQPIDDVVGDAVALLLAEKHIARQLGPFRVLSDHLAQQGAGALSIAPRLLEEGKDLVVVAPREPGHFPGATLDPAPNVNEPRSQRFHMHFTGR
jgi:hypothetical protein